jgi:hypothetical protein
MSAGEGNGATAIVETGIPTTLRICRLIEELCFYAKLYIEA